MTTTTTVLSSGVAKSARLRAYTKEQIEIARQMYNAHGGHRVHIAKIRVAIGAVSDGAVRRLLLRHKIKVPGPRRRPASQAHESVAARVN